MSISTSIEFFHREREVKANLCTLLARLQMSKCLQNEWVFDMDEINYVVKKLTQLSKHACIAKILCELKDKDCQNEISSIVFGTPEESDELQLITETVSQNLF